MWAAPVLAEARGCPSCWLCSVHRAVNAVRVTDGHAEPLPRRMAIIPSIVWYGIHTLPLWIDMHKDTWEELSPAGNGHGAHRPHACLTTHTCDQCP
jgi:hypothetical protein